MTVQFSVAVRNARLNAIEATIGASAIMEWRTGAPPASCAAADAGVLVASMQLPSDWMADAVSGAKALLGTWQDLLANAAGTLGHWRIKDSGGTVCGAQGTITGIGGGGDMEVINTNVAVNQPVSVTSFQLTEANG